MPAHCRNRRTQCSAASLFPGPQGERSAGCFKRARERALHFFSQKQAALFRRKNRSASIIAQITQGSAYQVGRYLLIHDGTTVTTIEESAVATGDMLGTFEGVINGSNVEFRVTMNSSSSATVTTKIDTVTV